MILKNLFLIFFRRCIEMQSEFFQNSNIFDDEIEYGSQCFFFQVVF